MLNFNDAVAELLGGLEQDVQPSATIQVIPANSRFEEFKQWAIGYVQEHDQLDPHHSTLQQIPNMSSSDEIEQLLRHNHDYCDECLLKMYRRFAIGEEDPGCGCGGE